MHSDDEISKFALKKKPTFLYEIESSRCPVVGYKLSYQLSKDLVRTFWRDSRSSIHIFVAHCRIDNITRIQFFLS